MDLRLQGKTALVTGSTSGIGEAIAVALAAEGVRVAINGRNVEAAERVIAEIGAARAVPALGDLSTGEGVASVAAAAEKQLGHVDILVNNAGQFNARPYDEVADVVRAVHGGQSLINPSMAAKLLANLPAPRTVPLRNHPQPCTQRSLLRWHTPSRLLRASASLRKGMSVQCGLPRRSSAS